MKKVKNLVFLVLLGVITSISLTSSVSAAGWKSTLNLPYGTIHGGASRNYKQGLNKISISVDGFNTSSGRVRKSGSTTMGLVKKYVWGHMKLVIELILSLVIFIIIPLVVEIIMMV